MYYPTVRGLRRGMSREKGTLSGPGAMLAGAGRLPAWRGRCPLGELEPDAAGDDRTAFPGQALAVAEVFQPGERSPRQFPPRCLLAPAVTGGVHEDEMDAVSGQLPECLFQPGAQVLAVGDQENRESTAGTGPLDKLAHPGQCHRRMGAAQHRLEPQLPLQPPAVHRHGRQREGGRRGAAPVDDTAAAATVTLHEVYDGQAGG